MRNGQHGADTSDLHLLLIKIPPCLWTKHAGDGRKYEQEVEEMAVSS